MKDNSLSDKFKYGMIWKLAEKIGAQVMQLIIQIVLARILMPDEYGLVGLLSVFIALSDVFILQGLTTALIQKKDPDSVDYSSVFYVNIAVSVLLYTLLFLIAPFVADFYDDVRLVDIMRVLSFNVVIGAFPAVHNAILSRNLDFKKSFFRNISNTVTQGVVGITLALSGFGAWSMVFSKLSGTFVGAIVLMLAVKWKPGLLFSVSKVKTMFAFSSKVLGTNLLNTLFNNIHALVIGHYYTPTEVGYYQRGQQIPNAMMYSIDGSMSEVLYPTFSKIQDDLVALKNAMRRSISISMYVVCPILIGLIAVAEPLTLFLLTEKWLPSVPFMRLVCLGCIFWPLSHRSHALNSIGRSDITLKLSVISKVITVVLLVISIPFGIYAMVSGSLVASFISFWITSYFSEKMFGYKLKELFSDILPTLGLSVAMGIPVFLMQYLHLPTVLILILQIAVGAAIYIGLSVIFKVEMFGYILNIITDFLKKRKRV